MNMIAKEKAKSLIDKFLSLVPDGYDKRHYYKYAKSAALISVKEISSFQDIVLEYFPPENYRPTYWQEVEAELESITP